ncbi:MAG: PTS sugar transporter subunit IIC, partial [Bacilli bacterium]
VNGETLKVVVEAGTEGAQVLQQGLGFVLPMGNLGSAGLFVGMLVAIFSVEVLRFTTKYNLTIKMPDSVPPSVANSFAALVPTLIVVVVVATITMWFGVDLHGIIGKLMQPVVKATDSIYSVWILVILITGFWSFGIHGVSIIGSLARPIWLTLLEQNSAAQAAGEVIPNVAPEQLFQWFIWIGGSGATIGLAILLLTRSRSSYGKTLGKTVIGPSIFNINEPVIFGCPIVLNPILIPPFIITPLVNATIAYLAVANGFVDKVVANVPWTLPSPIGAFLTTGGDFRAVILNLLLIGTSILIYYPFFVRYDNNILRDETVDVEIKLEKKIANA